MYSIYLEVKKWLNLYNVFRVLSTELLIKGGIAF